MTDKFDCGGMMRNSEYKNVMSSYMDYLACIQRFKNYCVYILLIERIYTLGCKEFSAVWNQSYCSRSCKCRNWRLVCKLFYLRDGPWEKRELQFVELMLSICFRLIDTNHILQRAVATHAKLQELNALVDVTCSCEALQDLSEESLKIYQAVLVTNCLEVRDYKLIQNIIHGIPCHIIYSCVVDRCSNVIAEMQKYWNCFFLVVHIRT